MRLVVTLHPLSSALLLPVLRVSETRENQALSWSGVKYLSSVKGSHTYPPVAIFVLSSFSGSYVCISYPFRRAVVMAHVNGVIAKLLSKGLMQFEFAHDLLWEYMQQATPVQMQVGTGGKHCRTCLMFCSRR